MQYTVEFTFAGQPFTANVEELPQTIEMDLENVINERGALSAEGTAKLMVLREGLKSLYRGQGSVKKPINLRDGKGNLRLPPVRDPETRVGIKESLLTAVTLLNDFLGHVDPFKGVFESYLPGDASGGDGDGVPNPTGQGAISPSGSITSLPTPPDQTPPQTPDGTSSGS